MTFFGASIVVTDIFHASIHCFELRLKSFVPQDP
jgi:hypothetical protein